MALLSHSTELIGDQSLEDWKPIGSGGFGDVYKARHKGRGREVAIKLMHHSAGMTPDEVLLNEVENMKKASHEFVVEVLGMYRGCPPKMSMQAGIVMELMRRGSIETLQKALSGPPPWPLVFRLASQVAKGMDHLHLKRLMHHDLKPSNVLLDDDLNAKLADFGLSRISSTATSSDTATGGNRGTFKYMPPEAFNTSYEPSRTFDIYSYGILLWSIVTGKEPYPASDYELVRLGVREGERPPCEEIVQMKAEGLQELVELMKTCWEGNPSKRPSVKKCCEDTENLFSKHKNGIHDAVHQVLTRLDSPHRFAPWTSDVSFSFSAQSWSKDAVDHPRFTQQQESVSVSLSKEEKAKFVDKNRAKLIQTVTEVLAVVDELGNMVHGEAYNAIKAKETPQDKMRELYQRILLSGGLKVKAAFYDALKIHHPGLVDDD